MVVSHWEATAEMTSSAVADFVSVAIAPASQQDNAVGQGLPRCHIRAAPSAVATTLISQEARGEVITGSASK